MKQTKSSIRRVARATRLFLEKGVGRYTCRPTEILGDWRFSQSLDEMIGPGRWIRTEEKSSMGYGLDARGSKRVEVVLPSKEVAEDIFSAYIKVVCPGEKPGYTTRKGGVLDLFVENTSLVATYYW